MVLDRRPERGKQVAALIDDERHFAYLIEDPKIAVQQVYTAPPDIIVAFPVDGQCRIFLSDIKNDSVYRHLPLLCLFDAENQQSIASPDESPFDDFAFWPTSGLELRLRIHLSIDRAVRYLDANPLSHLPGNFMIVNTVQDRLDRREPFGFAHLDLDHFKSFNDRYGFARGDEIIRMTARLLVNSLRNFKDPAGFVGHIGGDDFALVTAPQVVEPVCRQFLETFDLLTPAFYDDEDRARGYLETTDRRGEPRRFPLLSVSIAVILSEQRAFHHYGEIAAAANEIKHLVKSMPGSNFLVDRRVARAAEKTAAE